MLRILRSISIPLLLLATSFTTYYYALADIPRRDHILYMAERAYSETAWDWFWYSVSWSRTRFLAAGDAFLFRPLHMSVLALKDILLRENLFAAGAVNVSLMAIAGFSLYRFARRMVSSALALALAVLFMVQYAGLEIVSWGHISPYLLSLAFLGFALAETLKGTRRSLAWAWVLLFIGALFHEIIISGLLLAAPALLILLWRRGKEAKIGDATLSDYLVLVVVMPLLLYLSLYFLDFIYHSAPLPQMTGSPPDSGGLIASLFSFPGSAAVAFAAPFKVGLSTKDISHWNFSGLMLPSLVIGAAVFLGTLCAIALNVRIHLKGKASAATMTALLSLFMLLGLFMGVGVGRVYMRGVEYLYASPYYYSMSAYLFCVLAAFGLRLLLQSSIAELRKRIFVSVLFSLAVILIVVNLIKIRETLASTWPERKTFAHAVLDYGEMLENHSGRYCLAGSDSGVSLGLKSLPLREYFCLPGDKRIPGYLTAAEDGSLWLSEIRKDPFGPNTTDVRLFRSGLFFLSHKVFDKPDLALKTERHFHSGIVIGYRDSWNFLLFLLRGPLASSHVMKDSRFTDGPTVAVPWALPEHRVEVRHAGEEIYLFVEDYLVASLKSKSEEPGRAGILIWEETRKLPVYSDFVATASSVDRSFEFVPAVRLAELPPGADAQ